MTNTDPIDLAREVVRRAVHLDRDALLHSEKERLDLALAVLDLTEKAKKARALHQSAGEQLDDYGHTYEACRVCDSAWPCATSATLNGDKHDRP